MTALLSITESNVLTSLRAFLLNILPPNVEVVQGQDNYVDEPLAPPSGDFIVMTPTFRGRIETNVDTSADVTFTGNINGTNLFIATEPVSPSNGDAEVTVQVGSPVYGVGVLANTQITAIVDGGGGIGNCTVNNSQLVSSELLAAGFWSALMPTKVVIQLDVHGPNSTDYGQIIDTLFRDSYATTFFETLPYDVVPLYADNRGQTPFINGEDVYEDRWVIDVTMQATAIVSTGLQYAARLEISGVFEIDSSFPPEG